MHNCIICADEISQQQQEIALTCGHYFDVGCLLDAFHKATRDESLYPPQCCFIPIPFDSIRRHLPDSLVDLYLEKETEYKTPRRVYCASPMCSRFLGSRDDVYTAKAAATVRTCTSPDCTTRTCGRCTTRVSEGQRHACKMDKSERQALAIGRSRGWVRCPGCEEMVERTYGCFHMTCRCRTQFCYLCRAIWKTCKCTRWTARAAVIRRQPMLAVLAVRKIFWTISNSIPRNPQTRPRATCGHRGTHPCLGRRCQNCQQLFVRGNRCHDCRLVYCNECKLKQTPPPSPAPLLN